MTNYHMSMCSIASEAVMHNLMNDSEFDYWLAVLKYHNACLKRGG
jgi:hypothetical protein